MIPLRLFRSDRKPGFTRWLTFGSLALVAHAVGCATNPGFEPPPDDTPTPPTSREVDLAREIEEADIVQIADGFFYLVNPYTGLRIIDAREIARPVLAGVAELGGRGVEMFLRDSTAFVFTSADFALCAGEPVGFDESQAPASLAPDFDGSRLWVIDVSDPEAPTVSHFVQFDGFVSESRRVGDVIYVAGIAAPPGDEDDPDGGDPNDELDDDDANVPRALEPLATEVFVTSILIADPAAATLVQTERFFGDALDIHVSETAMYVLGYDQSIAGTTLVSYVDITDPAGAIMLRDQFRVPGVIRNRFFADEFEGTFRIVTDEFVASTFSNVVSLYVYDVSDPDDVRRLSETPIVSGEDLRAVRFDGIRGYAVTFRLIDPLFVLDLRDPDDPVVAGSLEVPGFSTHLTPLGERLVGVGFDDTNGIRPAVSLYDVSDPSSPSELSRIIVGEEGAFDVASEATVDEKALKVLQSAGLILLPFSEFDVDRAEYVDRLQLIRMTSSALREGGQVSHPGLIRRAGVLDDALWVLSDLAFQTVDASDIDAPVPLRTVELIDEQTLLDAGLLPCADSARFRGTALSEFFGFGGAFPPCVPVAFVMFGVCAAGLRLTRPGHRRR